MHYVDEGTGEAGTLVLLHGEPVWSYMYRDAIHGLAAAGYCVIAPDNIGFGKSGKVIDAEWYTLDHYVLTLKTLVRWLDLRGISIAVNDWGGPNGLIMATEMPDRFDRLIILNAWLHHEGYGYTDALRKWNVESQSIDFTTGLFSGTPRPSARNYQNAVLAPLDIPNSTALAHCGGPGCCPLRSRRRETLDVKPPHSTRLRCGGSRHTSSLAILIRFSLKSGAAGSQHIFPEPHSPASKARAIGRSCGPVDVVMANTGVASLPSWHFA